MFCPNCGEDFKGRSNIIFPRKHIYLCHVCGHLFTYKMQPKLKKKIIVIDMEKKKIISGVNSCTTATN